MNESASSIRRMAGFHNLWKWVARFCVRYFNKSPELFFTTRCTFYPPLWKFADIYIYIYTAVWFAYPYVTFEINNNDTEIITISRKQVRSRRCDFSSTRYLHVCAFEMRFARIFRRVRPPDREERAKLFLASWLDGRVRALFSTRINYERDK